MSIHVFRTVEQSAKLAEELAHCALEIEATQNKLLELSAERKRLFVALYGPKEYAKFKMKIQASKLGW